MQMWEHSIGKYVWRVSMMGRSLDVFRSRWRVTILMWSWWILRGSWPLIIPPVEYLVCLILFYSSWFFLILFLTILGRYQVPTTGWRKHWQVTAVDGTREWIAVCVGNQLKIRHGHSTDCEMGIWVTNHYVVWMIDLSVILRGWNCPQEGILRKEMDSTWDIPRRHAL